MEQFTTRLANSAEAARVNPGSNGSKLLCPKCGGRSFVPYIYTDSGAAVDAHECGRCDHECGCGYHLKPREYFELHPERSTTFSEEERREFARKRREELEHEARIMAAQRYLREDHSTRHELETYTLPPEYLVNTLDKYQEENLYRFLCSKFDVEKVTEAFKNYHIGVDKYGSCIYWQVDQYGYVRTGKIIKYAADGHRDKNGYGASWIHSRLRSSNRLPEDWQLKQCLFGLHLVSKQRSQDRIMIVEAEKSALICSIAMPQYTWLAVGGLNLLKYDTLRELAGYGRITLLPDLNAYEKWSEKAAEIKGLDLIVSDFLETVATDHARAHSLDIADYLLNEF